MAGIQFHNHSCFNRLMPAFLPGGQTCIAKNPKTMLYLIAIILVIGWLLGFFSFTLYGLLKMLLVIAVIAILFRVIAGRRSII